MEVKTGKQTKQEYRQQVDDLVKEHNRKLYNLQRLRFYYLMDELERVEDVSHLKPLIKEMRELDATAFAMQSGVF